MRFCRSCSPRPKSCLRSCDPDCSKPCCLPRRRCQSLSPRRPSQRRSCSPCDTCTSCTFFCAPRSRKCRPRRCNSYSLWTCPRERDFQGRRSFLSRKCDPCDPCKLPSCCTCSGTRLSCCLPKCNLCCPRQNICPSGKYDTCRPHCRPRLDSQLNCDPCYPPKCDTRYSPLRTTRPVNGYRSPVCNLGSYRTRKYCDPYNSCRSTLCGLCNSRGTELCRPRPCFTSKTCSADSPILKLRDLTCDKFRKVCYPSEMPTKICLSDCKSDRCNCSCLGTGGAECEMGSPESTKFCRDKGPSWSFLHKSRRLGSCRDRFDPHLCPWEADITISGTVRGHCTSTAVEVARRMSGKFKAEGDRFTRDSCAATEVPCKPGFQRLNLGNLDDGTALNLSRNNTPNEKQNQEMSRDTDRSALSFLDAQNVGCRCSRCSRNEELRDDCDYDFSAACRERSDNAFGESKPSSSSSHEHKDFDEVVIGLKPYCSRKPSHHSVRFDSANKTSSYHGASKSTSDSSPPQEDRTPCSDLQSFLNSRKNNRRRNRASNMDIPKRMSCLSPAPQEDDKEQRLSASHDSLSRRHHTPHSSSDSDSPMFTPPTHCSSQCSRHFPESRSRDNLDNITLNSRTREDSRLRHPDYQEISIESGGGPVRGYRRDRGDIFSDDE